MTARPLAPGDRIVSLHGDIGMWSSPERQVLVATIGSWKPSLVIATGWATDDERSRGRLEPMCLVLTLAGDMGWIEAVYVTRAP